MAGDILLIGVIVRVIGVGDHRPLGPEARTQTDGGVLLVVTVGGNEGGQNHHHDLKDQNDKTEGGQLVLKELLEGHANGVSVLVVHRVSLLIRS